MAKATVYKEVIEKINSVTLTLTEHEARWLRKILGEMTDDYGPHAWNIFFAMQAAGTTRLEETEEPCGN